jgi:4-amino-4-deoxychorismate lyase
VPPFTLDPSLLAHGDVPSELPSNIIQIRLDRTPTTPSIFTRTKTTVRSQYDEARVRSGIPPITSLQGPNFEVLLIDKDNHILETSIYNVAFRRSGRWLTPNAKYGCLPGVFRRFLLAEDLIDEDQNDTIVVNDVKDGEYVILCNGAQGCRLGRISLNEQGAQ